MTTKQALEIVIRAAESNANGNDRCSEIMQAVRLVKELANVAARATAPEGQP
jgi:hypothetical protein